MLERGENVGHCCCCCGNIGRESDVLSTNCNINNQRKHRCCCSVNNVSDSNVPSRNSNNITNHCKYQLGGENPRHHPVKKVCQYKLNVVHDIFNSNGHKFQLHAYPSSSTGNLSRGKVSGVILHAPNDNNHCKYQCGEEQPQCYHHHNQPSDKLSKVCKVSKTKASVGDNNNRQCKCDNNNHPRCVYNISISNNRNQQQRRKEYWTVRWALLVSLLLLNVWELCFILFLHPYAMITTAAAA